MDDEYFVSASKTLFSSYSALSPRFEAVERAIEAAVGSVDDDALLSADPDTWAQELAQELRIEPPRLDADSAPVEHAGRMQVDCTMAPGISRSLTETVVLRPGHHFRLSIPVTGEIHLLMARPSAGASPLRADLTEDTIVRSWTWPEVKGTKAFEQAVTEFKGALQRAADGIAHEVENFNVSIPDRVRKAIEARSATILAERDFLGSISIPIKRAEDAPRPVHAPPLRSRVTPARRLRAATKAPPMERGPDMAEFYGHILDLIRSVGRGMERSPGSFASAEEETLRDHMLVTLNTHYVGQAYAEAFNRSGKTDILIRIHDRNAFIGECKWWGGAKKLNDALDQLFGYTTWRDSRLALIFYVKEKNLTAIVEKARAEVEQRAEFISWHDLPAAGELRCRVRWPDDPERQAALAVLFFHIG